MKLLNLGCGRRFHTDWVNVDIRPEDPQVMPCDLKPPLPFADKSFDVVYHSHLLEHFSKKDAPRFLKECFRLLKPGGIIRVAVPDFEKIVRVYLRVLEDSIKGNKEAQKRYEWIVLEMFDQMVRNVPGGEMLKYWMQSPMPAESFVIERVGSEVMEALAGLRAQAKSRGELERDSKARLEKDPDALQIGRFRLAGEVHQWMYDRYSLGALLRAAGFREIRPCEPDESNIPGFNSYLLDIEANGSVRKPDSLFMEAKR